MTYDAGLAAHDAAEQHLKACWEAFYAQEDCETDEVIASSAFGPFCGCDTCVVREVLAAAWPVIEKHFAH